MLRDLMQRVRSRAVFLSLLLLVGGCSTAALPPGPVGPLEGRIITAEQIERTGARNAWEVLRQAHVYFDFYESRDSRPVHLSRRGGLTAPLVIVDGTPTEGLDLLLYTPAAEIASIRVLNGMDATVRYGSRAAGGAVIIQTMRGARR